MQNCPNYRRRARHRSSDVKVAGIKRSQCHCQLFEKQKKSAERIVAEIKSSKETRQHTRGNAIAIQADVRNADQVQRMVDEAIRQYGRIDILINNANTGRYQLKAFLETTWQDFLERYSDEMKAAYEVTRAVLPSMLKRQYGKLIYITTASARYTMQAGVMTFAIAKSSLVALSRYLAQEFGKQGITSNVLAPGLTETDANAYMTQEDKQQIASLTARGRVGQPEDVDGAVAFLASDDSNFVTGTYIPVDGGFILVG